MDRAVAGQRRSMEVRRLVIHEYYMIHESLWLSVMKCLCGMLCIGCVESRLGRKLTPEDFTDCALNTEGFGYKSARLANRLNY